MMMMMMMNKLWNKLNKLLHAFTFTDAYGIRKRHLERYKNDSTIA